VVQLWRVFKKSATLPDTGGWLQQAAWTIDAFVIIETALETLKEARRELIGR